MQELFQHWVSFIDAIEYLAKLTLSENKRKINIAFTFQNFILVIQIVRIKPFATRCLISGPFIVMVSHMIGDVVVFALLYLEFYIPYGKFSFILCST